MGLKSRGRIREDSSSTGPQTPRGPSEPGFTPPVPHPRGGAIVGAFMGPLAGSTKIDPPGRSHRFSVVRHDLCSVRWGF